MERGFRVGQIFKININVDFSWVLVVFLVTGTLVLSVFPRLHPEWSMLLNLVVGLLASALFFASVLTHEIAHSLMAKSQGIPVRNITLFLFGGVSDIEKEPASPSMEFLIAIVGPLTSIGLGLLFLLLGGIASGERGNILLAPIESLSRLDPIATLFFWLGPVNILVGLFNLIPGFPLDGGRVFRSLIWFITGDFKRATFIAAMAGQLVGWGFIAIGILMVFGIRFPLFGGGLISGLWIAFIGWFLSNIAARSYQQVITEDLFKKAKVSKMMETDFLVVSAKTLVSKLVDNYIVKKKERAFPVMSNSHLQGIVTLEDIGKIQRRVWNKRKVAQIMTPKDKLETVTPNETAVDALNKLTRHDINQLPVLKNEKLVGMISRKDILLWLQIHSHGE